MAAARVLHKLVNWLIISNAVTQSDLENRDAQFCECSAASVNSKNIGLYLLTDVRSHTLIVAL